MQTSKLMQINHSSRMCGKKINKKKIKIWEKVFVAFILSDSFNIFLFLPNKKIMFIVKLLKLRVCPLIGKKSLVKK
jgi:tyrosine-protein phosphatase YwqE